jgi:cytochrome P450
MTITVQESPIDLNDEVFLASDRTAAYAELRRTAPIARIGTGDDALYLASRHEDVRAIARIPEARLHPVGSTSPPWLHDGAGRRRLEANLAQTDAPVHTRLRGVIGGQFIPRRVEQLRAVSAASAVRCIDALPRGKEFDVVTELAVSVPRGVICHLLGVPEDDWSLLTENQHDFLLIFAPFPLDDAQRHALDKVAQFYLDYFENLLQSKPKAEHTPLVQSLLDAEESGTLSRIEVLSLMHTILDAGYETTRTSISNAVELLATLPGLLDQLRSDPAIVNNAVEELLRFRSPLHTRDRILVEDYISRDGAIIPAGSRVFMMLAAANLDELVFRDPERVILDRGNADTHQSFGGGLHHCLGAPIARIQLQETLKALARSFSTIEPGEGDSQRFPSLVFPSLMTLPVVVRT